MVVIQWQVIYGIEELFELKPSFFIFLYWIVLCYT